MNSKWVWMMLAAAATLGLVGEVTRRLRQRHQIQADQVRTQPHPVSLADARRLLDEYNRQEPSPWEHWKRSGDAKLDLVGFAYVGNIDEVVRLLSDGADPNGRAPDDRMKFSHGPGGYLPLHAAARGGHVEVVRKLIAAGADVNALDQCDNSPMCEAASPGHIGVAELLVHNGARVNQPGVYLSRIAATPGQTPLMLSANAKQWQMMEWLLQHGANPNASDDTHSTALMIAASADDVSAVNAVKVLLAHGAVVDEEDEEKNTPLLLAAEIGNAEVVRTLLAAGARVSHSNKEGDTALHLAAQEGYENIVEILRAAGADRD